MSEKNDQTINREAIKAERSRNLRYKRPALRSMGYDDMITELYDIAETCETVRWYEDNDEDTLLNALDGDEDALWEFKMAFADLGAKAEELTEVIQSYGFEKDTYDDCTVALIGNRYRTVGFDSCEEDYFDLTKYDRELAQRDAGKRFMRMTKADMLSTIGQSVGVLAAFLDLRQSYDYLRATMDILRDENTALLGVIKQIEQLYSDAEENGFYTAQYDRLLEQIPDRIWVE